MTRHAVFVVLSLMALMLVPPGDAETDDTEQTNFWKISIDEAGNHSLRLKFMADTSTWCSAGAWAGGSGTRGLAAGVASGNDLELRHGRSHPFGAALEFRAAGFEDVLFGIALARPTIWGNTTTPAVQFWLFCHEDVTILDATSGSEAQFISSREVDPPITPAGVYDSKIRWTIHMASDEVALSSVLLPNGVVPSFPHASVTLDTPDGIFQWDQIDHGAANQYRGGSAGNYLFDLHLKTIGQYTEWAAMIVGFDA